MNSNIAAIQEIATPRNAAILTLAVVCLFSLSFQSGRWTQRADNRAGVLREQIRLQSEASKKRDHPESIDLENVLIANVATVGFDEVYDMLRSAPETKRQQWVQELDSLPDSAQKTAALKSFYKTFVQIDPAAASASIDMLSDVDTKMTAAEAMVGTAPASGLQHVAAMLLKLPREFVSTRSWDYLQDVAYEWSWTDPEALARFFDQHPGNELENYHGELIFNWAQLHPDAARVWLEHQPPPKEKGLSLPFDDLVSGWFEKDPAAAENYLIAHADEEKLQSVIPRIARGAFELSPADALRFINRLPDDELKKQALGEIVHVTDAEPWPNDWHRPPATVANWMLVFPREWRAEALTNVMESWQKQDAHGLDVWLDQLSPEIRNQLVTDFCDNLGTNDEKLLVPIAMKITDANSRDAALERFLAKWFSSEDGAQKVAESDLTDAQKSYLLKLLPRVKKSSTSE